jgi:hypothetical protein
MKKFLCYNQSDEDIHTIQPSPIPNEEHQVAIKNKSNEIRIGPITRACAKLLEQQVNSLLVESDIYPNERFTLSKSLYVCMVRFIGNGGVVQGSEELQLKEHDVVIHEDGAREEREVGAKAEKNTTT